MQPSELAGYEGTKEVVTKAREEERRSGDVMASRLSLALLLWEHMSSTWYMKQEQQATLKRYNEATKNSTYPRSSICTQLLGASRVNRSEQCLPQLPRLDWRLNPWSLFVGSACVSLRRILPPMTKRNVFWFYQLIWQICCVSGCPNDW